MIFKTLSNKKQKEAFDLASKEALKVMQVVLTDCDVNNDTNYINFSSNSHSAENAPEALKVMQRFDTSRPNRPLGSTPSWGARSALFSLNNQEVII